MAKLCRQYGISRQNGYKWVGRYQEEGVDGLRDRSRRPLGSRVQASGEVVLQVLELRQKRGWGPKKLQEMLRRKLQRKGQAAVPSMRTIARIIARAGFRRRNAEASDAAGWTGDAGTCTARGGAQRPVDGGLQGVVAGTGRRAMRAAHGARRPQPLRAAGGAPRQHGDGGSSPRIPAAIRTIRPSKGDPERQRFAVRVHDGALRTERIVGLVGQPGDRGHPLAARLPSRQRRPRTCSSRHAEPTASLGTKPASPASAVRPLAA